ncbi:ROK family transcriptional regulator [Paenibacillus filicis]|uniref:ROK family transcriptional regulator n=1 Tax=Paenibacillus gyeongsangnamensis TaxID=3388067 RepID=A0ABT4Q5I8_9BACL|nr:ROK family transcriptional regulator [Paenibacillus filicis]MCZ8512083.1 ROK family transcriptional regulator [Paenibacillus filicis]
MNKPASGDSSFLKNMNKSTLLNMVRAQRAVSRAELAKRTKLTRATVSALVEELIEEHLVVETGTGESSGGRKPVMLELNASAGCVIGIDLRVTNLLMLVTDMRGVVLKKQVISYDSDPGGAAGPDRRLNQIIGVLEEAVIALPESPLGLIGVGVGIHGFVEYPSGRIAFMPHTGWKNLQWKSVLEERLGVPVLIDNEANLAALGEWEYGAGANPGCTNMLYLSVAGGIGAGLILNGELFRGGGGFAGEVGHTTLETNGRPCSCGNKGCWERYASEQAVAGELGLSYAPGITEELLRRMKEKDAEVLAALQQAGAYLGIGIGNMMHTLNPQMIVIGGSMSRYASWLHDSLQQSLQARFSYLSSFRVQVDYSQLGEDGCALGAATSLIRERLRLQPANS